MSEDDDDLQKTSMEQPVVDDDADDEADDLTDTVVSGMTAFRLSPEYAEAAEAAEKASEEDAADADEKGPGDTDETLAGGDVDDGESEQTEP